MGWSWILIALVATTGCGRLGFDTGTPTDANGDARFDGEIDGVPRPCLVWAVGTELSHWNGNRWTTIPSPTPAITMRAVWGASATVGTIQRGP